MNLLREAWIPVRFADGHREWVAPASLSDPRVVAFDADRADFNGALAQFAIGLLQTTSPAKNSLQWKRLLETPPDEATLHAWFEQHAAAFELDCDGPRFMQDFDLCASDGEPVAVSGLLIESPGENAVKNNSDHFIKRNQVQHLCPHCTGLALFTLQTNAPAGGAGHRTGVRGGGPLTTLLLADSARGKVESLWRTLWLNVMDQGAFLALGGREELDAPHFMFPWLEGIEKVQKEGGETAPVQVHPYHVFWAMPRRIRLDFDAVTAGVCDLCGRKSERRVQQYVTRNYGLNYKGAWRHPLSPYYQAKEGMLPMHPQPGGFGYRHWLGWVLGMTNEKRRVESAAVVSHFFESKVDARLGIPLRVWAFGFDMDNMKARCWYESTMPVYDLGACDAADQAAVREAVTNWISGAELAASYLRGAVKDAWFSHDARGDFSHVDASFWSRTERDFYLLLKELIAAARCNEPSPTVALSVRWLSLLQKRVQALFETEWVGTGMIERQNPARIAKAHEQLRKSLFGPKLRAALALPVEAKPPTAAVKKGERKTDQGSATNAPQ